MSAITKSARILCTMWMPLVVLALTLTATTWPRPRAALSQRVVNARLADIPSHNRLYRATLDLTSDSVWTLRLRSNAGTPIPNAAITMDAWMPEQGRVAHAAPLTTNDSVAGSYRVRPVALDRAGWWNISVQIAAAGQADSLAFNVILK